MNNHNRPGSGDTGNLALNAAHIVIIIAMVLSSVDQGKEGTWGQMS